MGLTTRPYKTEDRDRCAELAGDAWPIVAKFMRAQRGTQIMRAYVEIAQIPATWREVACDGGRVVGYLFGRLEADDSPRGKSIKARKSLRLLAKVFFGRYGRLHNPLKFFQHFFTTEQKVAKQGGGADGEILLYVVDARYRGQGIGRHLMNRFLRRAGEVGAKRITVYTDPLSNWRFYERYGFRRHATFTDDLDTYLAGFPVEGFIYALQIPPCTL